MVDDLSGNIKPELALPMGKFSVPKFLYFILIILGILILVVGGFYFYLKNNSKKTTTNNKTTKNEKVISKGGGASGGTNMEIAKKTLGWLDTQKNDKEIYSTGCFCADENCNACNENVYAPRAGIFPVWGKLKYLEKTGSENANSLSGEISAILNSELQFDSYACKFMYEMWQSKLLNSTDKNNVRDICRNGGYEAMSKDYYNDLTIEELDTQIGQKISQVINGENYKLDQNYNTDELKSYFRKAAIYVSEYTTREKLESEISDEKSQKLLPVFKLAARKQMAIALDGYGLNENSLYSNSILGIAAIDLYQMTDNKIYFDLSQYLYNKNLDFSLTDNTYDSIYFGLFTREMFLVTSDVKYNSKFKGDIVSAILSVGYDSDKMCFKNKTSGFYGVPENGLMVGLLN